MRVFFFIWSLDVGGAQTQVSLIADRLAQRGHDVSVVAVYAGGKNWQWLQRQGRVSLKALFKSRLTGAARLFGALHVAWAVVRLRSILPDKDNTVVNSTLPLNNLVAWLATRRMRNVNTVWWAQSSDGNANIEEAFRGSIAQYRESGLAVPWSDVVVDDVPKGSEEKWLLVENV